MKFLPKLFLLCGFSISLTGTVLFAQESATKEKEEKKEQKKADSSSLTFRDKEFIHRYSKGSLHEFTPEGQEDLSKWNDMLSIVHIGEAKNEEELKKLSDGLFKFYKQSGGKLFGMRVQDKTKDSPSEYLGGIIFAKENMTEYVKTKVVLRDGKVYALVYSHRFYLQIAKSQEAIKQWLTDNEEKNIYAMWDWKKFPSEAELKKLTEKTEKEMKEDTEKK